MLKLLNKIWANFQRIIQLFSQKLSLGFQKLGLGSGQGSEIRDQGPGKNLCRIPDPGFRIPDPGSRISDPGSRIPDTRSRIPDPGVKKAPDPGTATLVADIYKYSR
jgi:hypothetical protein